jgi:EAL domain-containing protein (putative c-di-GMP-specific phosphodiesterase class I)
VELTEYEELDIFAVKNLISFLKSEGVKVALDDVGSGYSGLFYLSELSPDIIKIDMELIRDIHKHNLKKVIVNYLIRLAHDSGILVVSEGVETKEELETVIYMGTDFVQGFIFSEPVENPNVDVLNKRVRDILNSV